MATFTIDQIAITRTSANIDDDDVFELQIKDGGVDDEKSAKITFEELRDAVNGGVTPLVYKATLTQTGTNAPVATVLENTLGGTLVWTRYDQGSYYGTLSGAFPDATKTYGLISTWYMNASTDKIFLYRDNANRYSLESITGGSNDDDILENVGIEIKVYP
jgi:hypothetical protein